MSDFEDMLNQLHEIKFSEYAVNSRAHFHLSNAKTAMYHFDIVSYAREIKRAKYAASSEPANHPVPAIPVSVDFGIADDGNIDCLMFYNTVTEDTIEVINNAHQIHGVTCRCETCRFWGA